MSKKISRVQLQCLAEVESGTESHRSSECWCGLRYRVQGIYHWFVPCILSRLTHQDLRASRLA